MPVRTTSIFASLRPKRPSANTSMRSPTTHEPHPTATNTFREPLMDDAQVGLMLATSDFAPRLPASKMDPSVNVNAQAPDLPSYPSFSYLDDGAAAPSQTQDSQASLLREHTPISTFNYSSPPSPMPNDESSANSVSEAYTPPTMHILPPLQAKGPPDQADRLEHVNVDDPTNFSLLESAPDESQAVYQLEARAQQLFSAENLHFIFKDPKLLLEFTGFLNSHRPSSVRTLNYYMDALKATYAINYANAVARSLAPLAEHQFTQQSPDDTVANRTLQEKADRAFQQLARDDLPAWITYSWTEIVSVSVQRRVLGNLAPHLREASEGLAEVFCLSDPSRPDNPIVFASEEFQRTTQYGLTYCVGRNCRFLQGPRTERSSVERLAQAIKAGKEHSETFLNYRRDGTPFMNLLMIAPLVDSQGKTRYFIGAQVDVSGLAKDCTALPALQRLVARHNDPALAEAEDAEDNKKDEFQRLSEILNTHELETVRKHGGRTHRDQLDADDDASTIVSHRPRLLLSDATGDALDHVTRRLPPAEAVTTRADIKASGRLQGVYENYLLVRPSDQLRILFASPSLRVPGILQSPLITRIGGSARVRAELVQAFDEGRGVTAKIKWLTRARDDDAEMNGLGEEGRSRWLHCTPLLGHTGKIGVWMVVIVDAETRPGDGHRRFREAPPVTAKIASTKGPTNKNANRLSSLSQAKRDSRSILTGAAEALKSHPLPNRTSQTGMSLHSIDKQSTHPDTRASSFYGVVSSGAGGQQGQGAPPISAGAAVNLNGTSRPQSEASFALR